jgi:hypothetical protein
MVKTMPSNYFASVLIGGWTNSGEIVSLSAPKNFKNIAVVLNTIYTFSVISYTSWTPGWLSFRAMDY